MTLLLVLACIFGKVEPSDDSSVVTDSGDADTDTDTDADTDDSGDTDDTAAHEGVLVSLRLLPDTAELTTRETVTFTAEAGYDDGSTIDVTASATWETSDPAVLKVYTPGVGQPLWTGSATVTATFEGQSAEASVTVTEIVAAAPGDLAFNEVLADGTVAGDPNEDGTLDAVEDEFVEIANKGTATVDLSGCTLLDDDFPLLPRHRFAEGTVLRAGEAIVVFGGGSIATLSADNAQFVVVENDDVGLQYGLSLNNDGETLGLYAPDATLLADMTYGEGTGTDPVEDASLVLAPEIDGTRYTHHRYASESAGDFSPGTLVTGESFPGPDGRY